MTTRGSPVAQKDSSVYSNKNSDLAARFESHASLHPDAPALTLDGASLSYGDLNARANQLAAYLRELGVGPEALVGIRLDRTFDLIIGIMAILKAGGAYLPLDLACPEDRLTFMLEDSRARVVLTESRLASRFASYSGKVVCLDQEAGRIAGYGAENVRSTTQPEHLAYVIYTSGSTGMPKGVLVTQENVMRLFSSTDPWFHFGTEDVWTLFHSSAFDFSVWEIFGALLYGGRLVIVPYMVSRSAPAFRELLIRERVTVLNQTPSAFRQLIQVDRVAVHADLALRYVIFGGEALEFQSLRPWFERYGDEQPQCINMYGITETTVHVTYRRVRLADLEANSGSNIGIPIPDLQVYVVDPEGRRLATGESGEMLVGGLGVARGYLNRADLSRERFITNPFEPEMSPRLYRTGDLARILENGDLEYLGRIDHQVKIRGFRIELNEIESMLARHHAVKECAVLARTDSGSEPRLVAYVVTGRDSHLSVEDLRAHLAAKLPEYMIPAAFVFLDAFPLTINGKLDREALPAPGSERPRLASEFVAPQNEMEKILADLWKAALRQDAVGVNDNFFDLGADSLMLTGVHRKLQSQLSREIPITDLFQFPTIASLAQHLAEAGDDQASADKVKSRAELQRAALGRAPPGRITQAAPMSESTDIPNGIAIIGMAGRFPGAPNLDVFWNNLKNGVESVTHFTEEELELPSDHVKDPHFVRARAIIAGVDLFDAEFFGIQPREADHTDPQHRLFLQTAWEALENAGYDSERYDDSIGVFGGCSQNTYMLANLASHPEFLGDFLNAQQYDPHPALLGNDKDFLTSRVAYKMNLRGPSMSVQSACSTSLVAVCQACQSLLNYQCDIALTGGVSITFPQKRGYLYKEGAIVSPDGMCRPFDVSCQGTVFGDGVGLVVLKRIDEAVRDGDQILAVIRGYAVNNDGSSKVSYMAPSVDGQADVISAAQALAGIDADTISYIEAHGTGTSLGDPIEVAALTKAFRATTAKTGFCALGAVKGNIGHLESAAGVTGLIKTVLALRHEQIPPTLHFSAPNPKIDFARSPFYVNAKLADWPRGTTPRRAGVSSFGVGGTNAHVVLEEAPALEPDAPSSPWQLLPLSARTPEALEKATTRLADYLRDHLEITEPSHKERDIEVAAVVPNGGPSLGTATATNGTPQAAGNLPKEINLADVAYTLQAGRRIFAHRQAIVCRVGDDISEIIAKKTRSQFLPSHGRACKTDVAFLLPGQGAQQVDMGRDFYEHNAIYRQQADLCCKLLEPMLGLDLREVLYPAEGVDRTESRRRLAETHLTQPALFVVEYALAQVWLSWGVKPRMMVGHSLGEYVAACLAGIFTLPDALRLLATRARLMQDLPGGTMLAVALPEEKIVPLLTGDLALAAVNGPTSCVVSGPTDQALAWQEKLAAEDIVCKALCTSHAFHSPMMDPILKTFEDLVAKVPRQAPRIPIVSTYLGRLATDEEWMSPSYWSGQLRQGVRFADAVAVLMQEPHLALLEVGPGQTLTALARQHTAKPSGMVSVHSLPRTRDESETAAMLSAAGQLWIAGAEISLPALHAGALRRRVALPTYPFELKRHWIEFRPKPKPTPESSTNGTAPASLDLSPNADNVPVDYLPLGDSVVEELITDQLRLMEQQLQLLRAVQVTTDANGRTDS